MTSAQKLARLIAVTGADNYEAAIRRVRRLRKNERKGKVLTTAQFNKFNAWLDNQERQ